MCRSSRPQGLPVASLIRQSGWCLGDNPRSQYAAKLSSGLAPCPHGGPARHACMGGHCELVSSRFLGDVGALGCSERGIFSKPSSSWSTPCRRTQRFGEQVRRVLDVCSVTSAAIGLPRAPSRRPPLGLAAGPGRWVTVAKVRRVVVRLEVDEPGLWAQARRSGGPAVPRRVNGWRRSPIQFHSARATPTNKSWKNVVKPAGAACSGLPSWGRMACPRTARCGRMFKASPLRWRRPSTRTGLSTMK